MSTRLIAKVAVLLFLSCPFAGAVMAQTTIKMAVGTYNDGSVRGMYMFDFNQKNGKSEVLDTLELDNPSYLTFSPTDKELLYVVRETNDERAAVSTVKFDWKTNKLSLFNNQFTYGEDPCYVSTNGEWLLTANYSGGTMSAFHINDQGGISVIQRQFKGTANATDPDRQSSPHVHCAVFAPDGEHIVATDFSGDRIMSFRMTPSKELIQENDVAEVSKGTGPRHLVFSQDGRFMYVLGELSGAITAFRCNENGMEKMQEVQSDTVGGRGSADIHISPDGRFLYASNRIKADGIAIFSIDATTGMLKKVGYQPTGIHPRNFNITPNGRFLLCACRDDNVIQVFRIDKKTGLLAKTNKDIRVRKPVCVQFRQ